MSDIERQAGEIARRVEMIRLAQEAIEDGARAAADMREAFLRHGFSRAEALILTRDWLEDMRAYAGEDDEGHHGE